jgi:hypothetical protein
VLTSNAYPSAAGIVVCAGLTPPQISSVAPVHWVAAWWRTCGGAGNGTQPAAGVDGLGVRLGVRWAVGGTPDTAVEPGPVRSGNRSERIATDPPATASTSAATMPEVRSWLRRARARTVPKSSGSRGVAAARRRTSRMSGRIVGLLQFSHAGGAQ